MKTAEILLLSFTSPFNEKRVLICKTYSHTDLYISMCCILNTSDVHLKPFSSGGFKSI
jgi:hypothetical protein